MAKTNKLQIFLSDPSGKVRESDLKYIFKSITEVEIDTIQTDKTAVQGTSSKSVYKHPFNRDALIEGYLNEAYHANACNVRAKSMVGTTYQFKNIDDPEKRIDAKMFNWFEACGLNDYVLKHLKDSAIGYQATGDMMLKVYCDAKDEPQFIERANPQRIWKITKEAGGGYIEQESDMYSKAYEDRYIFYGDFYADDKTKLLQMRDNGNKGFQYILHKCNYTPISKFYGAPLVIPAWTAVVTLSLIADWRKAYMNNNAAPSHMFVVEGADVDSTKMVETIKEYMKSSTKGAKNANRLLVLGAPRGGKITVVPISHDMKDGDFLELENRLIERVLAANNVPQSKAGYYKQGGLNGESTAEQILDFYDSIQSDQMLLGDVVDDIMRKKFKESYEGWYYEPIIMDKYKHPTLLNAYGDATAKNVLTPNEARAFVGMAKKEDSVTADMLERDHQRELAMVSGLPQGQI